MYRNLSDSGTSEKRTVSIQFVSDIHLEYRKNSKWWKSIIIPRAPYLVLAGDIAPAHHKDLPLFYAWCKENFEKVIHVPGNHEYWKYGNKKLSVEDTERYLKKLCNEYGIIYCQKDIIVLEDTPNFPRIVGCTLWTDVPLDYGYSADFSFIKEFTPSIEKVIHDDHVRFIEESLELSRTPSIVVTHHSPISTGTLRKEHENSHRKVYYVNELEGLAKKSLAWIFGHTHHVCDIYFPNGTVVTSNPIGSQAENLPYHRAALLEITY